MIAKGVARQPPQLTIAAGHWHRRLATHARRLLSRNATLAPGVRFGEGARLSLGEGDHFAGLAQTIELSLSLSGEAIAAVTATRAITLSLNAIGCVAAWSQGESDRRIVRGGH